MAASGKCPPGPESGKNSEQEQMQQRELTILKIQSSDSESWLLALAERRDYVALQSRVVMRQIFAAAIPSDLIT